MSLEIWVQMLNVGAWGLAGYAVKYIIDDNNRIKAMSERAIKTANQAKEETRIFSERLLLLMEKISDIRRDIDKITEQMRRDNDKLIEELKKEIQNLKK